MSKDVIYTHEEAANIVSLFEDFLSKHNICIVCKDPEELKEQIENGSILYGMEYDEIFDKVEERLIRFALKTGCKKTMIITNVFPGFKADESKKCDDEEAGCYNCMYFNISCEEYPCCVCKKNKPRGTTEYEKARLYFKRNEGSK